MAKDQAPIKERFKDKFYMNWQKACQVLLIGKKNVDEFVNKKLPKLHEDLRISITDEGSCGTCMTADIKKKDGQYILICPNGVKTCQSWVQELTLLHSHPERIYWKNSDMRLWPSSHWEVAKVYMGNLQDVKINEEEDVIDNTELPLIPEVPPHDIDISHVLNVLTNCKLFHSNTHKKGTINEESLQSVKDVQNTRNELFHNPVLKTDEEGLEKCKSKMEQMMTKLEIYDENYENEIQELLLFDPLCMDRSEYEKFLRLEACVTASYIDENLTVENEGSDASASPLLDILNNPENDDLRASVSMIRNIPGDIGDGAGEGEGEGDLDVDQIPEPSDADGDRTLELNPIPVNSYNIHMTLPSAAANVQNNEKLVLEREESFITEVELPQGSEVYDGHLEPDKHYTYRLKVINSDTSEEGNGPWSEINTPADIRITPQYIQWQALCRMLLDFAGQKSRKYKSPRFGRDLHVWEFTADMDKLSTIKQELYKTHMLSVSREYWIQISEGYLKEDPKLQEKYNYILYNGSPKSSAEKKNAVKIPVQQHGDQICNISEPLFLADFLCHMYRGIEADNNPSHKREELNSIFCMFKNDLQLRDAVNSQLKYKFKNAGVIDLDIGVSSIDEIEVRWKQCENRDD